MASASESGEEDQRNFKGIGNIKEFISLPEIQKDKILSLFSDILKLGDVRLTTVGEFAEKYDLDPITLSTATSALFQLLSICTNEESISYFLEESKKSGFSEEEINSIKNLINKLKEKNLLSQYANISERMDIEKFGLPYLSSIQLMGEFRFRDVGKNKPKEIVPVVLCTIKIEEDTRRGPFKVIFQFSRDDLNYIISQLQQFRQEFQDDIDIINKKFSI